MYFYSIRHWAYFKFRTEKSLWDVAIDIRSDHENKKNGLKF